MHLSAVNKLALGTAQFGLDYGINNERGKIPEGEAFSILDHALRHGINFIDTAFSYGDSEAVIGKFISKSAASFKVVSKAQGETPDDVTESFNKSLERLHAKKLYGSLLHSFQDYSNDTSVWEALVGLKADGKVQKIGFSLYYPSELDTLLERKVKFDIVQIPYNIFDQRFSGHFALLKKNKVELHARSVFLQGLFFKDPGALSGSFTAIKGKLTKLSDLSTALGIPKEALCLIFAVSNPYIDKVIIGVDSLKHLEKNIEALKYEKRVHDILGELLRLREEDEAVIVPSQWNAKR